MFRALPKNTTQAFLSICTEVPIIVRCNAHKLVLCTFFTVMNTESRLQDAEKENQRYGDSSRGSYEQLSEVCMAVLTCAQKYNAFVEEVAALQSAVSAWQTVVEVSVSRRWAVLEEVTQAVPCLCGAVLAVGLSGVAL